jgi:pyruvate decarboxylase
MGASYNEVPRWAYSKLCETFGPSYPAKYYRVETGDQQLELCADSQFVKADCTQVSLIDYEIIDEII